MVTVALFVKLQAKPDKEKDVISFLEGGLILANQETATTVWFSLQLGPSTFGIFDTFTDEERRNANLTCPIAAALMANAEEPLTDPPKIERVDVLAARISG